MKLYKKIGMGIVVIFAIIGFALSLNYLGTTYDNYGTYIATPTVVPKTDTYSADTYSKQEIDEKFTLVEAQNVSLRCEIKGGFLKKIDQNKTNFPTYGDVLDVDGEFYATCIKNNFDYQWSQSMGEFINVSNTTLK